MIMLDDTKLLERVVPPLAKRFGATKEMAWGLLENQNNSLQKLVSMQRDSKLRGEVNEWWRQNRHRFPSFGMIQFVRLEPKSLPQSTYEQVICLMWLTSALKVEPMVKAMKKKVEAEVPEPSVPLSRWQRLIIWLKNILTT